MSAALTDSRRMWKLSANPDGLHSHDARRLGVSGNPSQRAKDIADHVPFWTKRETRNGRPGSRYFADGFQPVGANRVRANGVDVGGGTGRLSGENGGNPQGESPLTPAADVNTATVLDFRRDSQDPCDEVLPYGTRVSYGRAA